MCGQIFSLGSHKLLAILAMQLHVLMMPLYNCFTTAVSVWYEFQSIVVVVATRQGVKFEDIMFNGVLSKICSRESSAFGFLIDLH
jgi:hypothetical protein